MLESVGKNEAAWLMAAYSPVLGNGLAEEPARRAAPASERSRLAGALRGARRALVDCGMLRRPTELSTGNFLRNTLRRYTHAHSTHLLNTCYGSNLTLDLYLVHVIRDYFISLITHMYLSTIIIYSIT